MTPVVTFVIGAVVAAALLLALLVPRRRRCRRCQAKRKDCVYVDGFSIAMCPPCARARDAERQASLSRALAIIRGRGIDPDQQEVA